MDIKHEWVLISILIFSIIQIGACTNKSEVTSSYSPTVEKALAAKTKGNLTDADFEKVSLIMAEVDDDIKTQGGGSYGLGFGGSTSEDVWFNRGKKYCLKLNWSADECKKRLFEFRRIIMEQEEKERELSRAEDQVKVNADSAKKEKEKNLGY